MDTLQYPSTKKIRQFDDYHGTTVADPYRWLEDTDAPETRQWIAAQNRLTKSFLWMGIVVYPCSLIALNEYDVIPVLP